MDGGASVGAPCLFLSSVLTSDLVHVSACVAIRNEQATCLLDERNVPQRPGASQRSVGLTLHRVFSFCYLRVYSCMHSALTPSTGGAVKLLFHRRGPGPPPPPPRSNHFK